MKHRNVFILLFVFLASVSVHGQENSDTRSNKADSIANRLREVVVSGRQPVTKSAGASLISTIPGSVLQHVGTALDVLEQLPLLKVEDGAVHVIGRGTPPVFIDGRPLRSNDELLQLRSEDLKKVELNLAPGAKYDSEARAVLLITTRRHFRKGLSVTERAHADFRRKTSANDFLGLNHRSGRWDLFADGAFNHSATLIKGTTTKSLLHNGQPAVVGASQRNNYPPDVWNVKPGFNYTDSTFAFGAYYKYNHERGHFTNHGTEQFDAEAPLPRNIRRLSNAHTHSGALYLEKNFPNGARLHFDGDYRLSISGNETSTTYSGNENDEVRSSDERKSSLWAGKLYFDCPLWQGDLTIGTQYASTRSRLYYRMLHPGVAEYIPSSLTDSRQTSAAAFASWSRTFRRLSLNAGLRCEYVDYTFKLNGKRDNDVSSRNHFLTPDITIGYNFDDRAQLSLSYKTAVVKPSYAQLSGSLSYTGLHEIEGGNTNLRDERRHSFQITGQWNDFMMQGSFQRCTDTYAFVCRPYPAPTLQLLMQPVNADATETDIYFIWQKRLNCWMPNITTGIYKPWMRIGDETYNRPIFSYSFDNIISLPSGFLVTINIYGQSSGDMRTNRFGASGFVMDASFSKTFLKKALQIKLSATDIFNTANNRWTMNTCGVFVNKRQKYDRRGVSLSLTYRFQPRENLYRGKAANEAELNRL